MTTPIQTSGDFRQTRPKFRFASPDAFVLTLWTAHPGEAAAADAAGIQRVGVDLERAGKAERQAGLSTWISPHTISDLLAVGPALTQALPFARIDPIHARSHQEIERVLQAGARVVMAPMVASESEAAEFAGLVAGRACTIVLIERREALDALQDITVVDGVDEIHVGLNDLSLSLNLPNRWAVLAGDLMRDAAACVIASGRPFGFGGIGRANDTALPIPSDLVYAEYARTGATRALVARSFTDGQAVLATEVPRAFRRLAEWREASPEVLASAHEDLGRLVRRPGGW